MHTGGVDATRPYGRRWGWLLLAGLACRDVTPPELAGATPMPAQAPYALWWAAVEACSGLRGDFAAVRWAVGPDSALLGPDGYAGFWYGPANQITLARRYVLDGSVVRHEMLHALLNAQYGGDHPPAYFRGRCAGYVTCSGACAAAPGTPPTPVAPGAPVLTPAALGLRARLDVLPTSSPADANGGWLVLAVSVQNPHDYGVIVQLAPAGALSTQAFGFQFATTSDIVLQESDTLQLGPGAIRRYVFDVRTAGYPPGVYVARGTFNTAPADSAVVTIRP